MEGETRIMNKSAKNWLHPNDVISAKGVTYAVRYIGCLEIHSSMKSLDFDTRSLLAKECINRVCEAAGLKTANKKRKTDKRVLRAIADSPIMQHAGANVNLTISSCNLSISTLESGQIIARHDMPRISFASGGDTDTLDFVAYVAKNLQDWRACYVLECGGGLAQDVITTIGQAFDLRFKEFMVKPTVISNVSNWLQQSEADHDYYNDLPNKVPPDLAPPVPPMPQGVQTIHTKSASVTNLIDFAVAGAYPPPEHNYVNEMNVEGATTNDVFDMQPFSTALKEPLPMSADLQHSELLKESWFHGPVSRAVAEALLLNDGDFLVRESQASTGQYVLTGMQGHNKKHLLLIDPEGVVRTKDRMFESVSHLINYHCTNALPIISSESALVLRNPIHQVKTDT